MPPADTLARGSRRTAAEAIVQADARERIRTARSVRQAGYGFLVISLEFLAGSGAWRPENQFLAVHIHGGPSFTLSVSALIGILALAAGPIAIVTGSVLLRRATDAARRSPVTAQVLAPSDR